MAEKIFQGFELLTEAQFNALSNKNKQKIYFVRTDTGTTKEDGFIYFNGKKYGTGKLSSDNIQKQLEALKSDVDGHIGNQATVSGTTRTTQDDNGNLTVNDSAKWLSGAAIAEIKKYVDSEDVKSMFLTDDHKIQLKNKDGVVLADLDASKFIKDGMLESVTLTSGTTEGKVLRFTWNTASGKEKTITDIEVSEFFHEISGDTNTIIVSQPASGTTGSLQISANTVKNVTGVTSGATALMTGGITQKYVTQQINNFKTGLTHTLNLTGSTGGVTYATAAIVQKNGVLTDEGSSLKFKVAVGIEVLGGLAYNDETHDLSVTGLEDGNLAEKGLVDGDNLAQILRNNNKKVVSAFSYLKNQITTLSNKMTTVTGSPYITVTKATGTNNYTVSASGDLETAINNANRAVKSVNGISGENIIINTDNIKASEKISGYPSLQTNTTVTEVLNNIYSKLKQTSSDALTSVNGSNSITVGKKESGSQTISVKRKTITTEEKGNGYIQIEETTDGIYGLLYFGGDDVEP